MRTETSASEFTHCENFPKTSFLFCIFNTLLLLTTQSSRPGLQMMYPYAHWTSGSACLGEEYSCKPLLLRDS